MTIESMVGGVTLLLSTLAKGGAVDQLRIIRAHGPAGWSWRREALIAASYASWAAYGCLLGDVVVTASGLLGTALSGLLLAQAATHRRETPTRTTDPQKGRGDRD